MLKNIIKRVVDKYAEKNLDPVTILPKKVLELVFAHLKGGEVLRSSLVNKDWYKALGKSNKAMEKIGICVCEDYHGMYHTFTSFDAGCIINGSRNYRHISMFITRNMTTDHLLLIASFQWKTLLLCHHSFRSEIELINFIGLIELNIEDLNLRSIKVVHSKKNQIASPKFSFPKLRKLKIANCCTFVYGEIFRNIEQLNHLEIETGPPPVHAFEDQQGVQRRVLAVQLLLVRNYLIRHLALFLHQKDFDYMFIDNRLSSHVRFQLQSIKLGKFRKLVEERSNDNQLRNFGYFLEIQERSLQSIHLFDWLGNAILEQIICEMDRLKFLLIEDLDCYGKHFDTIANMELIMNESLESLNIVEKCSKVNGVQKLILKWFPCLKHLRIGTVNQDVLDLLIEKTPKLETLTADIFIPYIIPEGEVLTSLKKLTITSDYATHFKDMLRDYKYYTSFEKVFLTAAKTFDLKYRI